MFRFLLLILAVSLSLPVFAQTGQDSVIQLPPPDTARTIDTSHHLPKPVVEKQLPVNEPIDTAATVDTAIAAPDDPLKDSFSLRPLIIGARWRVIDSLPLGMQVLMHHPYFDFGSAPVIVHATLRKFEGKETMFYALVGYLLLFALIRQGFGKYFNDLFRVFFRSSLKQRQIREQLMQSPLPSLVFNFFFVASAGLYLDFIFHYFKLVPVTNFWLLYLYCCIGLIVIYLCKFIGLKITGWLFKMTKAADAYTFIVFSINKIIGVFLLPFPVLLAFTSDPVYTIAMVVSWCGIGALLLYRFILGFGAIRNEVRFNLFHFFLYLCAFELAPLLLIYKLLLLIF